VRARVDGQQLTHVVVDRGAIVIGAVRLCWVTDAAAAAAAADDDDASDAASDAS